MFTRSGGFGKEGRLAGKGQTSQSGVAWATVGRKWKLGSVAFISFFFFACPRCWPLVWSRLRQIVFLLIQTLVVFLPDHVL